MICFQPFKHYHRQALDRSLRLGVFDFNQLDFIAAFNEMRTLTFKRSTILSAFEKIDLISYNPEIVLAPLREKLERRNPVPAPIPASTPSPSSSHTASTWPTPTNVSELRDFTNKIYNTSEYIQGSESFQRRFNRLMGVSLGTTIWC